MEEKRSNQFETSLSRLEEIVTLLESGQIDLDESVALFREGKELTTRCEGLLLAAEATIARITEADRSVA